MKRYTLGLLLAVLLTACGSQQGLDQALFAEIVASSERRAQPSLSETLNEDALAGLPGPLLLLKIPSRNAEALAGSAGDFDGHEVWATQDAITLSFQSGVLSTTRGLGNDLMSADLSEVVAALGGQSTEATRTVQYLTGEEQIETRVFLCDYLRHANVGTETLFETFVTTQTTERCVSSDRTIENRYWVTASGTLVKSKQWIGPLNGYLYVERIKD